MGIDGVGPGNKKLTAKDQEMSEVDAQSSASSDSEVPADQGNAETEKAVSGPENAGKGFFGRVLGPLRERFGGLDEAKTWIKNIAMRINSDVTGHLSSPHLTNLLLKYQVDGLEDIVLLIVFAIGVPLILKAFNKG